MVAPRWVRRVTIAPAVVLVAGFVVVGIPLILLVGLALSPIIPGRWVLMNSVGWAYQASTCSRLNPQAFGFN